ncbi:anthranilate synthase component I [Calycomorphotria hydatis]|uniref:Anthranilate synthase component 1 n=1 Tax=Calycomorphotria hydatis TaxID=2528027 RepID=A0A517T9N8_9PLAN|nr:anthranilate synthase component I [Calycomorphotria hydatis]QDT65092.1 Anthranilate synthase component 1 [Calycomorphotria hydatis]
MHRPTLEEFRQLSGAGYRVPIFRQLIADGLTPISAYCRLRRGGSSFLFESVVGGERIGRYSFLGSDPFLTISAHENEVTIADGEGNVQEQYQVDDPLDELQKLLDKYRAVEVPELPRFCGGAVGYTGYDVVRYTESLPNAPTDDRHLPDMHFAFYDRMVVFDQINKTVMVIAHADPDTDDAAAEYHLACRKVDELARDMQRGFADLQITDVDVVADPDIQWQSNFTKLGFEDAVRRCKEYIEAGDIFQVVLSQRLRYETQARPLDIYRALRVVNPSPFMFLLSTPQSDLVGCSPEIMVRVEDGHVTIRPLAGTRIRGANEEEDNRLAEELLADPKERAEHVMLIDLARNDVGRVAEFGSVKLSDVMVVEKYSHVMHITSNVTGNLREGTTALDALRAGLPAGTVSGAPKVRAMEIIDDLEPHRRGPYAGAVGYIDFTGNMDTCIALRTIVMSGQTAYLQAGAGIVADSDPASEYQETLNKAKVLLKAIQLAEQQL